MPFNINTMKYIVYKRFVINMLLISVIIKANKKRLDVHTVWLQNYRHRIACSFIEKQLPSNRTYSG